MSKNNSKLKTPSVKVYATKTGKKWKEVHETMEAADDGLLAKEWEDYLIDVLEVENLIILAGGGTSLGDKIKGPSMSALYENVKSIDHFKEILELVKHNTEDANIEVLLSHCHSSLHFLEPKNQAKVTTFIKAAEKLIAEKCRNFMGKADLSTHETLIRRLSRRSLLKPRMRLFTTNYDLCFERSASQIECPVIDGFSFSSPQRFNPRFFNYDIVRRSLNRNEPPEYLEGVFHLYKVHGSVDWERQSDGSIERVAVTDKPCLIYPASTKYEYSYSQPHLEMMSHFLAALREPNTTLLILGFGFNDLHLSEPIISTVHSNSGLRLIYVDPECEKTINSKKYQKELKIFIDENDDRIILVTSTFDAFVYQIPNLGRQTEEERLASVVERISKRRE
jgi:hypothetical protein